MICDECHSPHDGDECPFCGWLPFDEATADLEALALSAAVAENAPDD